MSSRSEQPRVDPALSARLGHCVGEWWLQSILGVGGMACVYEATNGAGDTAAVKIMHASCARDPQMVERFAQEARILQRLSSHRASIAFFGQGETHDGLPLMAIERLRGRELSKVWEGRGKRLPMEEAIRLCSPVLELLDACHREGIVHRDLKPANLFVCDDGSIKVLDFGVARLQHGGADQTQAGTAIGTASYMAPEQAIGRSDITDGRADLFALGAILYTLVSGERLRPGKSYEEVFIHAATVAPPSLARVAAHLPLEFIQVVDKALAWDPRERFQSAQEMREALLALLTYGAGSVARLPDGVAGTLLAPLAPTSSSQDGQTSTVEEAEALLAVVEVFRALGLTVDTARRYTWSHVETRKRFDTLAQLVEEALHRYPEALQWSVKPSTFVQGQEVLWAPEAPLDTIPYNLFAGGVHYLHVTPGVTRAELERFLQFLVWDAFSPDLDLGSRLWELDLKAIRYQLVLGFHFQSRDEADEAAEDDPLSQALSKEQDQILALLLSSGLSALVEARSMSLGLAGPDEASAGPLYPALSEETLAHLEQAMSSGLAQTAGIAELLLAALQNGARDGGLPQLSSVLEQIVSLHVRSDATVSVMELVLSVAARLHPTSEARSFFVQTALGRAQLSVLLDALAAATRSGEASELVALTSPLLELVGDAAVGPVLSVAPRTAGPLYEELLGFLFSHSAGFEAQLGGALRNAPLELGGALVRILATSGTEPGRMALQRAHENGQLELRFRALEGLVQGWPEQVAADAAPYLEHAETDVRVRALRLLTTARDKALVPLMTRRISSPAFHEAPHVERRLWLEVLHGIDPAGAERAAMGLIAHAARVPEHANGALLGIHFLAQRAASREAVSVLERAADPRWGFPAEATRAALMAVDEVRRRMEGRSR